MTTRSGNPSAPDNDDGTHITMDPRPLSRYGRLRMSTSAARFAPVLPFLMALGVAACGPKAAPSAPPDGVAQLAGTFTFEPRLGTAFRHTLRRVDDFEIVGSAVRETEESELVLDVTITPERNLYRYSLRPVSYSVALNGAPVFDGTGGRADLSASGAEVVLLINGEAVVTEIRGAETVTKAMSDLAPLDRREIVARMFAPRAIEQVLVERVVERTADLLGNHSNIGNSWGTPPRPRSGPDPLAKQVEVVRTEDCGAPRCVVVRRHFDVDETLVWQAAEARVKDFVKSQGGDPATVRLLDAQVKLEDELVVDPRTLEFHGARFEQSATITAQGPQGNITVRRGSVRTSKYDYAQ